MRRVLQNYIVESQDDRSCCAEGRECVGSRKRAPFDVQICVWRRFVGGSVNVEDNVSSVERLVSSFNVVCVAPLVR
jgi:hypothetical protein